MLLLLLILPLLLLPFVFVTAGDIAEVVASALVLVLRVVSVAAPRTTFVVLIGLS
jgi:hypothetical protein